MGELMPYGEQFQKVVAIIESAREALELSSVQAKMMR